MSVEQATIAAPPRRPLTATERNWLIAVAIVVASAVLFEGIARVEMAFGRTQRDLRLVYQSSETSMRLLALSHFLVALVFMSTSKRMKSQASWLWFFGLLAGGVLLCVGFARIGGMSYWLGAVLFYVYFLLHEFRDQAMFYRANGDAPPAPDAKRAARGLWVAPLLIFGVIAATFVAGAAFDIGGARRYRQMFVDMSPPLRWASGLLPILLVAAGALAVRRHYDRTHPEGFRGWLRQNRPVFLVFLGIYFVLMGGLVLTGRVYAIVTLHVTAWYVFSIHQNATRPAPTSAPRHYSFQWMRTTTAGFNFIHLGIAALVILAAVVWAYAFDNSSSQSAFRVLLSRDAFPYWTIMHVSVSWMPR